MCGCVLRWIPLIGSVETGQEMQNVFPWFGCSWIFFSRRSQDSLINTVWSEMILQYLRWCKWVHEELKYLQKHTWKVCLTHCFIRTCYTTVTFKETRSQKQQLWLICDEKPATSMWLWLCVSPLNCVSPVAELIYKEVLDWEERTKNGVIRGQSASIGQWSFCTSGPTLWS